jgi:hypothetical protein
LSGAVALSTSIALLTGAIGTPAILTIVGKIVDPVGIEIVVDIDVTAVDTAIGPR